jgi:hypothetical protein
MFGSYLPLAWQHSVSFRWVVTRRGMGSPNRATAPVKDFNKTLSSVNKVERDGAVEVGDRAVQVALLCPWIDDMRQKKDEEFSRAM